MPCEVIGPFAEAARAQPLDGQRSPCSAIIRRAVKTSSLEPAPIKASAAGPSANWNKPPPERRDVVVIALGRGLGDDVDLPIGEAELPVELAGLRTPGLGVGQIELGRTRLQNDVAIGRIGDFAEALGRQYDRRVLLAQGPQPFLELGAEGVIGQHHPGFVDDDEGGPPVEPLLDAVKQIGQHRDGDLRPHAHQGFELEGDEVAIEQHIVIGVEKAPERPGQRDTASARRARRHPAPG